MRILLVDDDEPLMTALANSLIEQHYAVDIATDGESAWEFILLFTYDLVVLDVMLPKLDGISLCRRSRAQGYQMPILLLTSKDNSVDKVKGFDAGADDYVVKPFDFDELTARIRALLRREGHYFAPVLKWENLTLDPRTCEVKYQDQLITLTPKEYNLLELFLRNPQQVFSAGAVIERLWSFEDPPGEEAVRTHIKGLRHKLKAANVPKDMIETVYGMGYRLRSEPTYSTVKPEEQKYQAQKTRHLEALTKAWQQFKPNMLERLAAINAVKDALITNSLTTQLQQQARASAHKLAGSLGSFGFPEGSKIAKVLEQLLIDELASNGDKIEQLSQLLADLTQEIEHQPFHTQKNITPSQGISLLVIDNDLIFVQQLAEEATTWGISVVVATNLAEGKKLLLTYQPNVVLLKIAHPEAEYLTFMAQLHQQYPLIPIVTILAADNLTERLAVIRQGGSLLLQSPVTPQQAIASVNQLLAKTGSGAKVMIVDDDAQLLAALKIALEAWGFYLLTINDLGHFWSALVKFNPDLLILDIEMPEINGMELCQLLRSDPHWQSLPILFLTVHHDDKTQHQAFAIGADDYLNKPIVPAELANRILNRLARVKSFKSS
ncbi:multi-component transcriptional regulator, winged helix family [Stanieria cyanosphaera PCC 7437]|uniref:Multi-component transcriptional regulator, winged helix family n=1 Tax=Stanieria cyanosphaera (strain ATCC 29371 / PCC 7437) TaxID=111780 RepID=K9XQQ4_STAC7|nr:response regulator [Stanieria cyanosphaera]AFZ34853.1 multi-component transcriptional regulator, winged helix family [Stanieria cyanosphaera PCC 7437]